MRATCSVNLTEWAHWATINQLTETHMGEICESGFIEKIGHFFWDFQTLFWQLMKRFDKKENGFSV